MLVIIPLGIMWLLVGPTLDNVSDVDVQGGGLHVGGVCEREQTPVGICLANSSIQDLTSIYSTLVYAILLTLRPHRKEQGGVIWLLLFPTSKITLWSPCRVTSHTSCSLGRIQTFTKLATNEFMWLAASFRKMVFISKLC